eukprot:764243-Hanusia_phi.AAC.1
MPEQYNAPLHIVELTSLRQKLQKGILYHPPRFFLLLLVPLSMAPCPWLFLVDSALSERWSLSNSRSARTDEQVCIGEPSGESAVRRRVREIRCGWAS